jgi:phosphatidylinositol alpha-1,6-mannosyltransferase
MAKPRVFLGADSLAAGNGGICRVARLMARVLDEQAAAGKLEASAAVFSDAAPPPDLALSVRPAAGSRLRFAASVHRAAFAHSHFLYDFVGMARAHSRWPFQRRPFLTFIHGVEIWKDQAARPDRIEWARRADRLLSNTTYTRQRADRDFGGFDHTVTCWLATETDAPPQQTYTADKPPTVLILARVDPGYGKWHDALVSSWPEVAAAVPGARLIIGGRGAGLDPLKQRAAASPARDLIEFPGFVPEDQIDALWSRASAFVMPSRVEGFGMVYIEAMRYGVPVIASVHDAAPEVNLHGVTGFNVDMDNPADLPQRIIELLGNRALAETMSQNAFRRWHEHFRYSAWRDRFTPLLWEFINNSR